MKLRGSMREAEIESSMGKSEEFFKADPAGISVFSHLLSKCGEIEIAFLLDWFPDQGEDTYLIFVDLSRLFYVEVDRETKEVISDEEISMHEFHQKRGASNRLKIAVAKKLSREMGFERKSSASGEDSRAC